MVSALLTKTKRARGCTDDTSSILDGEESDACEVLELLVSTSKDELQEHFWKHQSVPLSSQPALQEVLSFAWSCNSPETANRTPAKKAKERPVTAEGWGQAHTPKPGPKDQSSRLTQRPQNAAEGPVLAGIADAVQTAAVAASDHLISQPPSTNASIAEGSQAQDTTMGVSSAHASKEASPAHVRVHASEQAEPILAAWRACRSPLELSQAQEIACLVCQRHISTTVSGALALPLVLPSVKVCDDIPVKAFLSSGSTP